MDSKTVINKLDLSFADGLHPDSRVWIYHADRVLTSEEAQMADAEIKSFCTQWASHSRQLKATGCVLFNRIVLLMVDESMAGASGCSIDTSVSFVKNLGVKYQTNLFDRMLITYIENDKVKTTKLASLGEEIQGDKSEVLIFDNLIKTKSDLQDNSIVPVMGSWVERFI